MRLRFIRLLQDPSKFQGIVAECLNVLEKLLIARERRASIRRMYIYIDNMDYRIYKFHGIYLQQQQ